MTSINNKGKLNELALFAGAGGGLLASKVLGWRTVCAVELDHYCRSILIRRQNERFLDSFPIWDDVRTFDGKPWVSSIDIVTGGFPCQAFSNAAAGKNNADDLWPEMFRIVANVSPKFVFAENVSKYAIDKACDDLETVGYKTKAISLSASDMGADHVRERHWLFAYSDDKSELLCKLNAEMAVCQKLQNRVWQTFSGNPRMDDGVANRMERFKATGNGQVPIVAATAWRLLNAP
jgi:DNA (cytosine-5)-methyltransferase 1